MGRERSMASMAMKWRHHIELLSEGRVDYDGGAKRDMDERKEGQSRNLWVSYAMRNHLEILGAHHPPNANDAKVTQLILALKLLVVTTCVIN